MNSDLITIGVWTRRVLDSTNLRQSLLVLGCVMVAGCSAELSHAEQDFYGRSARIRAGQTIEDVKRELGEPTRIVDGSEPCRDRGGAKDWVYESFETSAGREPLQGGSVSFCVTGQGVVVARFHIYH